jgi:adenylate cyclase
MTKVGLLVSWQQPTGSLRSSLLNFDDRPPITGRGLECPFARRAVAVDHGNRALSVNAKPTKGLVAGGLVAAVGLAVLVSPLARPLEQGLGLSRLFQLRGPIPTPEEVTLVTVDQSSTDRLGLPEDPLKWSRLVHARLVETLQSMHVRAIAFDMHFADAKDPDQDTAFARALQHAGNVVLFESVRWEPRPETKALPNPNLLGVRIERRIPPADRLTTAARGTGAFPLPKVPVQVSQIWLYKPEAGDAPSLPMVTLQVYAEPVMSRLRQLVSELAPAAVGLPRHDRKAKADAQWRDWHAWFDAHPGLAKRIEQRLEPGQDRVLHALLKAYGPDASRHLNFYGPPGSFSMVPFADLLSGDANLERWRSTLADRAVFIGFAERVQPDQADAFHTVYSSPEGIDISGVEIAATAFANLLNDEFIVPAALGLQLAIVLIWGLLVGASLRRVSLLLMAPLTGVFALAYLGTAQAAFSSANYWLPLATPLALQLPLALLLAMTLRLRELQRERRIIRRAFGYHLPNDVVDRLAQGTDLIDRIKQELYGVCLSSDVQNYTQLSENLAPAVLHQVMNLYFQSLFEPVRRHGGIITDAVGDAMLAIWTQPSDRRQLRLTACVAALEVLAATRDFRHPKVPAGLPTRLGLHCGDFLLGHVGALDHFEYRAVGDIVNTTSRIQTLGKPLGARLLASAPVIAGLHDLHTRELGDFLLPGKDRAVNVHEIVGLARDSADPERQAAFARGLSAFRERAWREAETSFQACLALAPDDGPASFYLRYCRELAQNPPNDAWHGELRVDKK